MHEISAYHYDPARAQRAVVVRITSQVCQALAILGETERDA